MRNKRIKLSMEPYKGVRDFYPEDKRVQNYIFDVMRQSAEALGYEEYSTSVLEPAELYRAKSGDEIVNEQMYVFRDRGGREVALRPELTPSLARLVARRRRELAFPLRLYSIANMFRYERPQRGRLREHWQLNADVFGVYGIDAEAEIIFLAYSILKKFGLKDEQFEIRLNSRSVLSDIVAKAVSATTAKRGLHELLSKKVIRILDKWDKVRREDLYKMLGEIIDKAESIRLLEVLEKNNLENVTHALSPHGRKDAEKLKNLLGKLAGFGIKNVNLKLSLARGLDYYNGIVFEVFDAGPKNQRALFGGGRYDNLLDIFGAEPVGAIGFGMGDVAMRDVLETYNLIPKKIKGAKTELYICILEEWFADEAAGLAKRLRDDGLKVAVDYSYRKAGAQVKTADKLGIPFVLCVGEEEIRTKRYNIKKLKTGEKMEIDESRIVSTIIKN